MGKTMTFEGATSAALAGDRPAPQRADDKAMLKAAANLTRDLNVARPAIYWADMLGSALLGYGALAAAMLAGSTLFALMSGVIAVLALYRAGRQVDALERDSPRAPTRPTSKKGAPEPAHRTF